MPTDQQTWEQWFESVWAQREDIIYRQLFGDIGASIHTIPAILFERMGQKEIDPRWTTHGVFECPPVGPRVSWLYVTSGLSNPWGIDPQTIKAEQPSGLGFEIVLQTPTRQKWAIQVLHWLMGVQILAASGLLQGEVVSAGMRIPLHTSIDPDSESLIRNLIVTRPEEYADHFHLHSGVVELLLCIGITDSEMEFARNSSTDALLVILKDSKVFPITDASRKPVTDL